MLNRVHALTAITACLSFCFVAQAETVWWDHEYNGTATPSASHAAMSRGAIVAGSESIVSCPTCIGGSYYQSTGASKWNSGVYIHTQPDANTDGDNDPSTNPTPWDKAAGYWPRPHHTGCPGQIGDASNFGESGWHIPSTGYGNPGCFPGDGPATLEIRFKWTCETSDDVCTWGDGGGLPLMYPSMQYQGLLNSNAEGFDSNYIEFATWGNRPRVDIGDDWVVIRMVVKSSWEGMDYYVHDDGSLEPGTSNNRGADWQDAAGNNQFGRDETERVLTFASNNPYPTYAPEQNDAGWKGFETATMDGTVYLLGGNATFQVDYIRWAFDTAVHPTIIPEPATMALVGLSGGLLLLKRRRQRSS